MGVDSQCGNVGVVVIVNLPDIQVYPLVDEEAYLCVFHGCKG